MISKILFSLMLVSSNYSFAGIPLELDTIQLEFPKGWSFNQRVQPITGTGPRGETIYATVITVSDITHSSAEEYAQKVSESLFLEAQENLKIVDKVKQRNWLANKGVSYSSVAQKRLPVGGTVFLLQYILAYDRTLIYLTVEGTGDGKSKAKVFDEVMQNLIWNNRRDE